MSYDMTRVGERGVGEGGVVSVGGGRLLLFVLVREICTAKL